MAGAIGSKTGEDQFTSLLEVLQQLDVLDRIIALTSDQGKDVCAAPTCAVVTVIVLSVFPLSGQQSSETKHNFQLS